MHGDLTIAAFATAVRGLIPAAVAELGARYPALEVTVVECDPERALPELQRGAVDVVVDQFWPSHPSVLPDGLSGRTVLADAVDLAVPADHHLAGRGSVVVDELHDERWISWPRGSNCHRWLLGVLRGHGIEPRIAHEAAEHPTQLALVAAGLGVAVVPRLGRGEVTGSVRFLPFRPTVDRHVRTVWRTGGDRRPAVRAALAALTVGHGPDHRAGEGAGSRTGRRADDPTASAARTWAAHDGAPPTPGTGGRQARWNDG